MKKNFIYLCILGSCTFVGCTKTSSFNETEPLPEKPTVPASGTTYLTNRTYSGMVDLAQLPNGSYTNGQIIFDQIIYSTGSFVDGQTTENLSFHFDPIQTPNVLWSTSRGPYFAYAQGTVTGGSYSPSFISSYLSFDSAYTKFIDSGFYRKSGQKIFSMPVLSDYLPSTGGVGEMVVSGVVVRKNSSATTLAVAPGTFSPIPVPGTGVPNPYSLGLIYLPSYTVQVDVMSIGMPINGDVSSITVYDVSNNPVTIKGFVASYSKRPSPLNGWNVEGEMTLLDNSIVSISGVADGF